MIEPPGDGERIYFTTKGKMTLAGQVTPYSTVNSWATKGIPAKNKKLIVLESWYWGRRRYTTDGAVLRFRLAQNQEE